MSSLYSDDSISREEMRNYFMNVNSHVMTRDFVHAFQEATIITPVLCVYCTGYVSRLLCFKRLISSFFNFASL